MLFYVICNYNNSYLYQNVLFFVSDTKEDTSKEWNSKLVFHYIIPGCVFVVLVLGVLVFIVCFKRPTMPASSHPNLAVKESPSSPVIDLNSVIYDENIGQYIFLFQNSK